MRFDFRLGKVMFITKLIVIHNDDRFNRRDVAPRRPCLEEGHGLRTPRRGVPATVKIKVCKKNRRLQYNLLLCFTPKSYGTILPDPHGCMCVRRRNHAVPAEDLRGSARSAEHQNRSVRSSCKGELCPRSRRRR